jgi:chromosome partitioning protein
MKTIVATNIRGGCGKTTNVLHLAIAAAKASKKNRVLAVDLDPQAHLTFCLVPEPPEGANYIDDLLMGTHVEPLATELENLRIIPGRMELTHIQDSGLLGKPQWERTLAKALHKYVGDYDYALIDTPAAYFKIHTLATVAADFYIISMRPEAFSLKGFTQSIEEIETFKAELEMKNPEFVGYFLNGVPKAKRLAVSRIKDLVSEEYTSSGYEIPQSVLIDESRWSGKTSIFSYPSARDLQKCYMDAWRDMAKHMGGAQ